MHKLKFSIIYSILLCVISSFCLAADLTKISSTKTTKKQMDKDAYSTINLTYPTITTHPAAPALNQEIKHVIKTIIQSFKKNLAENQPIKKQADLPLTVDSNQLEIDYKIFRATSPLFSIRFSIYTNFYGAAHPFTTFQSLNYDVHRNQSLKLNDIFKSRDYLPLLSNASKKILTQKLSKAASTPTEPYVEGLKPLNENFEIWNLTDKGLFLTFPPYQVAAYVFGPQEVVIPYSNIQSRLRNEYRY